MTDSTVIPACSQAESDSAVIITSNISNNAVSFFIYNNLL